MSELLKKLGGKSHESGDRRYQGHYGSGDAVFLLLPLGAQECERRESEVSMDLYERRSFLSDRSDPTQPKGTVRRNQVSNLEIWAECFGRNPTDMRTTDSYAIAAIMMQVDGWEKSWERHRIPIYGQQRMYMRSADFKR